MDVAEIMEAVDIVDYISQFCELEQKSDGEFWGLSPLREENTPSFSVNQEKGRFYDFSSGQGGNILDFIKAYNKVDFREALSILKKYANITEDTEGPQTQRLLATSIARKYRQGQKQKRESKSTILPSDYMDRYVWDIKKLQPWLKEGMSVESLMKFQVRYDPYSDRIVYPILDTKGNIINVSGRTLDPKFKEKNLRKYTYFKPLGLLDTIYGLAENREEIMRKREIILFEGAKSVILADSWGIKNCGCLLTSHLNPQQFKILIRLGVRVVFALDAEVNIREDKNIMKLIPYVSVEWLQNRRGLLDEKDAPVDKGEEVFRTLYAERRRVR